MAKSKRELLEEIRKTFPRAEELTKEWLEKIKQFKIEYWPQNKPSSKPFDIIGVKRNEKWAIEVKSGTSPQIKVDNFKQFLKDKTFKVHWGRFLYSIKITNDYELFSWSASLRRYLFRRQPVEI